MLNLSGPSSQSAIPRHRHNDALPFQRNRPNRWIPADFLLLLLLVIHTGRRAKAFTILPRLLPMRLQVLQRDFLISPSIA